MSLECFWLCTREACFYVGFVEDEPASRSQKDSASLTDSGSCSWELRSVGSSVKQHESVDFHFMLCLRGISMMF